MMDVRKPPTPLRSELGLLSACAALILTAHFWVGNGYGFHRDELQLLDDARHLQWGFVAYPPLTAFCGRIAIALFGSSPQVFRIPAAIVNAVSLFLAALMARELGGRRPAQLIALFAAFPVALAFSSVLQYNTFDLLAWSFTILFSARLLRSGEERNWIGIGIGIGVGVLSKYSIAFLTVSLLGALVLLPSQRHHLRSRWFWCGLLTAALIAAPNLIWLARHQFITLRMEHFIHGRDVRIGRADGFYSDQIKFTALAFPLAVAGLVFLLRSDRFRLLSAFYVGPFLLFAIARGRGYYLLPAYPVLYAAGAVALENTLGNRDRLLRITMRGLVLSAMLVGVVVVAWTRLPIWQPRSSGWNWQMRNVSDMADEVGWPEFVAQVAGVRDSLPAEDRGRLAILANNYGEAGALSLYGPRYDLPTPISPVNSFYDRGYGSPPPETVIVTGANLEDLQSKFEYCSVAAQVRIPYGVRNEESKDHPQILICRHLRGSWEQVWRRRFG